ncbi:MAG: UDP-N-acetylglucosamine 2-epimerase (non-hydrolyzing), partial [Tepidisphaeraceae bacterium]
MKRVSLIFGTRPEAIKLCPLVREMKAHSRIHPHVCITGQHRQMLDQVLEVFAVAADVDLCLMQPNQTLASLTARALTAVDGYLAGYKPDMVIVQGDTTTAFVAALAAFYRRIPVGHVEAGLRTWNRFSPFPEESNRVFTSRISDLHFAPTAWARENLLKEGIPDASILVTGNTVIDALQIAVERVRTLCPPIPGLRWLDGLREAPGDIVLITGHRRENFGDGFDNICQAIAELAIQFPSMHFVYPVHLNPNVRDPVFRKLSGSGNIHLIEPLSYLPFVRAMSLSKIILTDSGGVQEEAPSLGKPVLVMRDTTERPEAVTAGTVRLVGASRERIVQGVAELLTNPEVFRRMSR